MRKILFGLTACVLTLTLTSTASAQEQKLDPVPTPPSRPTPPSKKPPKAPPSDKSDCKSGDCRSDKGGCWDPYPGKGKGKESGKGKGKGKGDCHDRTECKGGKCEPSHPGNRRPDSRERGRERGRSEHSRSDRRR